MKYLLNIPYITRLEKKYINQVLESGWLSINGKNTKKFEKKFSNYLNTKYSIAVQSGTAAVHTALRALGVKKNERVIIPNYTCVSNISCLSQINAIPVIVEIEKDTFGMDFDSFKKAAEKYKPKAVQIVHVYGYPARDTNLIHDYCKKKKIFLIEDASESLGAEIGKKKVGTFGDIGIFSLRSEKMIGVGEGGVLVTKNKKIFDNIKLIASRHAPFRTKRDPYWKKYFVSGEGYNYLMPHLPGAIARAQIENFTKYILNKKIKLGFLYRNVFKNNKDYFIPQKLIKTSKEVFWLNCIYFNKLSSIQVKKLGNYLIKKKIEVRSGFWPLDKMNNFKSIKTFKNSHSQVLYNKILILPSNIHIKKKDLIYFKKLIDSFLKKII
jgi:perosamine synthetase